jgi:DNA mismatch repair ATPase MutS
MLPCANTITSTLSAMVPAISVMRLRRDAKTCRPTFTDGKYLEAVQVVHPLIEGCTANTLTLDGTGLLLTGSNMSGKTPSSGR